MAGGMTCRASAVEIGASRDVLQVGALLEDAVLPVPWVSVEVVEAQHLRAHKVGRFWKLKLREVDNWVHAGGAADAGQKPDGGAA